MMLSDTLPADYIDRREELRRREEARLKPILIRNGFIAGINRFLEDGIRQYIKRDVGALGLNDWTLIQEILNDWQSREVVRIVKPLDEAGDDEIVIKMLKYVGTGDGFKWPDLPPEQA